MASRTLYRRLGNIYTRHPNLTFWAAYAALNLLVFLPLYLLNRDAQDAPSRLPTGGLSVVLNRLFVWREGADPLRVSIELTLLAALWVWVRPLRGRTFQIVIATVYLSALAYAIYEAVLLSIWLLEPNFYSQNQLARDGIPFLMAHLGSGWWPVLGALVGVAAAITLVLLLLNALYTAGAAARLTRASRAFIAIAALLCLVALFRYPFYTARPEMVASSLGYKLERNIRASLQLRHDVRAFDDVVVQSAYGYAPHLLARKPDIFLIFVESYGRVLYKRDDFRAAYTRLLAALDKELAAGGWHAASALSISPTWGGGSWMAYTSAMLGVHIDNQPQYLSLLNKYQVDTYPSLGRTLHGQGYHFAYLSALDDTFSEMSWQRISRFYGIDTRFRHGDLNYQGPGFGWGPAPPDQYTLNQTIQSLRAESDQPLFLFTITQNSHYPWVPLPTLADDWRTLSGASDRANADPAAAAAPLDPETIEHNQRRQNYLRAVTYQLQMLTRLIEEQGDDNSLFVLVGDHQPPVVSRRNDGWETPVHVISRDQALVDAFQPYGFTPGLEVENGETTLHHEGLYSLLMRVLVARYGAQSAALPGYLPNGAMPMHQAQAAGSNEQIP